MSNPVVFVVDDAPEVRDGVSLLLESADIAIESFDSAEAFLEHIEPGRHGCIVLDMKMGGMSGLDLQAALAARGIQLPIIFLTAHGDIPTTVLAMKAGAVDFLTKPVDGAQLLDRVQTALARSEAQHDRETSRTAIRARLESLTQREYEILELAVAGLPNKEIARKLGISYRTVEVHRSHILAKTGATTLLELAQLVSTMGRPPA